MKVWMNVCLLDIAFVCNPLLLELWAITNRLHEVPMKTLYYECL